MQGKTGLGSEEGIMEESVEEIKSCILVNLQAYILASLEISI